MIKYLSSDLLNKAIGVWFEIYSASFNSIEDRIVYPDRHRKVSSHSLSSAELANIIHTFKEEDAITILEEYGRKEPIEWVLRVIKPRFHKLKKKMDSLYLRSFKKTAWIIPDEDGEVRSQDVNMTNNQTARDKTQAIKDFIKTCGIKGKEKKFLLVLSSMRPRSHTDIETKTGTKNCKSLKFTVQKKLKGTRWNIVGTRGAGYKESFYQLEFLSK